MKKNSFLLILLVMCTSVLAQLPDMNAAYNFYVKQDYNNALKIYYQAENKKLVSADLFYNIGNCYYRTKQLGKAVVYYEKALRLEPTDAEAYKNLNFVKSKLVDKVDIIEPFLLDTWIKKFATVFNLKTWTFFIFIFLITVIACCYYFKFYKRNTIVLTGMGVFAVLLFVSVLCANWRYQLLQQTNEIVLIEKIVSVKAGPTEQSQEIIVLHEGFKSNVVQELDTWINIELSNGNTGWIQKSSTLSI